MKATMLSKKELDYLDHHLHNGLECTMNGLNNLLKEHRITLRQHDILMQQVIKRHLVLWRSFTNHLVQKTLCLLFAAIFGIMQIMGDNLDMRKPGRRRNETTEIDG
jgi:hypothetical protein